MKYIALIALLSLTLSSCSEPIKTLSKNDLIPSIIYNHESEPSFLSKRTNYYIVNFEQVKKIKISLTYIGSIENYNLFTQVAIPKDGYTKDAVISIAVDNKYCNIENRRQPSEETKRWKGPFDSVRHRHLRIENGKVTTSPK